MLNSVIENDIQRDILHRCRFLPTGAKYSELKIEKIENDLFNYHLQHLVKKGFLEKSSGLYLLTSLGKSYITNVDEEDLENPAIFKVSVYMCVIINNKVLLYRRKKHPQYDYTGLPGGKIKFGEKILKTAERELYEETGLKAKFNNVGVVRQIRKDKQRQVIEDGTFYVCFTDKTSGELRQKGREGDFFWVEIEKVSQVEKLFKPSCELILKEVSRRIKGDISWGCRFVYELAPESEEY